MTFLSEQFLQVGKFYHDYFGPDPKARYSPASGDITGKPAL